MKNSDWKCSNCGYVAHLKFFVCPSCHKPGMAQPVTEDNNTNAGMRIHSQSDDFVSSEKVSTVSSTNKESNGERVKTGISEFDRLLDGGIVDGQVILIGAEPGFGKSTLAIEILGHLAENGLSCLYASGEESRAQVAERAKRVNATSDNIKLLSTTLVEDVFYHAKKINADVVVVDSLQTMASNNVDGLIGGQAQSKEAAIAFKQYAKANDIIFILISQFNKNDEVAGSNQIAHIVDTILIGDADSETRLKFLRSQKNRYGKTDEVAVFVHTETGLESVSDPSKYLIGDDDYPVAGAAQSLIRTGSRILPVELNALVTDAAYGSPQRQFNGVNASRGKVLIAACSKYIPALRLSESDVFVNTLSGIQITDPNADLALVAAVAGSAISQPSRMKTAWIGEVTLTGLVRGRSLMDSKISEAARLGFKRVVIPAGSKPKRCPTGLEVREIEKISGLTVLL